jgi:transposase
VNGLTVAEPGRRRDRPRCCSSTSTGTCCRPWREVTWWNFYFRLFKGTIRSPQVVEFLTHLLRHVPGKILVIWDGSTTHRSKIVRDFVAGQNGRLTLEFLPGYAPELNPVEYLWGYWKHHELPNLCPKDFWQLSEHARKALRRMRRRPRLVTAFWKQAELF